MSEGGREKKGSYVVPGSFTIKTVVRPIGKQSLLRRQQSPAPKGQTIVSWRHSERVPDLVRVIRMRMNVPFDPIGHDIETIRGYKYRSRCLPIVIHNERSSG